MADHTEIEWTDATWNPITGCSIVSPGCTHCYAMALAGTRLKNHESRQGLTKEVNGNHVWTGEVRFNEQWLDQPLRWTKPRMIFVCAHGDLFAEGVPDEWIDQVFAVMALAPQHTFQVLTKRSERMREYLTAANLLDRLTMAAWKIDQEEGSGWAADIHSGHCNGLPLPNVWLGVSVEDQRRADERIPTLISTPAAIRWISAEPLLGPVDLTQLPRIPSGFDRAMPGFADVASFWANALSGSDGLTMRNGISYHTGGRLSAPGIINGRALRLDWVVAGGESGPNARPMHPDWARSLRDQCAAAGVPHLFKQWGEYAPRRAAAPADQVDARKALIVRPDGGITSGLLAYGPDAWIMDKLGKRRAGRLLDGVEHNGYPTSPQRQEVR